MTAQVPLKMALLMGGVSVEDADGTITEFRAEVLREAVDWFERACPDVEALLPLCMCHVAPELRRMADEAERCEKDTREDESTPGLTVFRASHDSIVMGLYTTAAEARKHCETLLRRELPTVSLDWIEDEEDGVAELVAAFGEDERPTGYVVTALEVASKYDPEADE